MKKIKINSCILIGLNFYKVTLINIYKNYSDHLAGFIRIILFTLLKGTGVTEIKIFGAKSEYDSVFGVKEDVINLILNIKSITFNLKSKKKLILNLSKSGKCVVKASDFNINNKWLKIINPNNIIAHLSENSKLNINIKIAKGRGYNFINDKNYKTKRELNGILLDTNFSPILKVYYKIFELNKNYNKIEFFIQTNGTISGLKAVNQSINILIKQFSKFSFKKSSEKLYCNLNKNYFINIFKLKLSNQMFYYFRLFKINYLGDLIQYTENDLSKYILSKSLFMKIKKILIKYKLNFNTKIKNWINVLNKYVKKNFN